MEATDTSAGKDVSAWRSGNGEEHTIYTEEDDNDLDERRWDATLRLRFIMAAVISS